MISLTAEYAIRAMVALKQHGTDAPLHAEQIAQLTESPANYLSKILHTLTRSGLLTSARGRNGGFRLAPGNHRITAMDIVEKFDLLSEKRRCFLGNAECSQRTACAVHDRWDRVWSVYEQFLETTTLAQLVPPPAGSKRDDRKTRKSKHLLSKKTL